MKHAASIDPVNINSIKHYALFFADDILMFSVIISSLMYLTSSISFPYFQV